MRSYRWTLVLCTVLALPATAQERGLKRVRLSTGGDASLYTHSYALVIGVQSYMHWDRLINPVKDAHEVGSALKQQGFKVTYLDDPDAEKLKAGLHAFAYGREGQDEEARVVVFFAGHGHTEKVASGYRGFILPRDAPRPEGDRVGFMSSSVSMDFIRELARGMLAKHVLFIFDSCFSGTLLRGTAHPEPITRKTAKKVRQFITSGSADEQVPDVSVFKASLLNALDGDADQTNDGYVTGEELGWYLKGRVMEYTRGAQTPQYGKINDPNLDQGDMVFMPEPGSGMPPPEPNTPPPPVVQLGNLQVNVNAPNSRVYVDGTDRGIAGPGQPLDLINLSLGSVRVRVRAVGYQEQTRSFSIRANEWTQAGFELMPIPPPTSVPLPAVSTTNRLPASPPSIVVSNPQAQGTNPRGEIEVHPRGPISFDEVILGEKVVQTLVVTNTGDRQLQIQTNPDTREVGTEPASLFLGPDESMGLQVYFTPEEPGDRFGQIQLVDNDAKELAPPIKIQGKGRLGEMEVHPRGPISFDEVILGEKVVQTLVVTNTGDRQLQIQTNPDTREVGTEPASLFLGPDESMGLQVYFTPEEPGDRFGQIQLVDNDAKELAPPIKIQGKGALGN